MNIVNNVLLIKTWKDEKAWSLENGQVMKHSIAAVEGECELEKLRGDEAGKHINNYLLVCYSVK